MIMKKATFAIAVSSLVVLTSLQSACSAQEIENSVITVDELLRIDNAQALEKARGDAIKSGLFKERKQPGEQRVSAKLDVPLPHWAVKAIFGNAGKVAADLVVDGSQAYSITTGSTVAMCTVKAIEAACVMLVPANAKVRHGSCPTKICWTGNELSAELRPPQLTAAESSKILPPSLPLPPMPIQSSSAQPASVPLQKTVPSTAHN